MIEPTGRSGFRSPRIRALGEAERRLDVVPIRERLRRVEAPTPRVDEEAPPEPPREV